MAIISVVGCRIVSNSSGIFYDVADEWENRRAAAEAAMHDDIPGAYAYMRAAENVLSFLGDCEFQMEATEYEMWRIRAQRSVDKGIAEFAANAPDSWLKFIS